MIILLKISTRLPVGAEVGPMHTHLQDVIVSDTAIRNVEENIHFYSTD